MSKLWAFGDSFTYGHALKDCFNYKTQGPGPAPSMYAWPQLLGNLIGAKTENHGKCGADNTSILSNIMECHNSFGPDDTVVILWSFLNRYSFFDKDEMRYVTTQVTPWGVKKWTKEEGDVMLTTNKKRWSQYHAHFTTAYNDRVNTILLANTAAGYLKTKVKKVIQSSIEPIVVDYFTKELMQHSILDTWGALVQDQTKGLDNSHPSESCHREFADYIYKVWKQDE